MKFDNLTVEWKGHAGFFISNSKNIYIDPYKLNEDNEKADIVLLTHSHYDHCSIEDLKKIVKKGTVIFCSPDCQSKLTRIDKDIEIKIMAPGQEQEASNIDIKAVHAYNIEESFHQKQEGWLGYIIKVDEKRIYHAGDTDLIPEMNEFNLKIDLALLPVGGQYTMNAEEAARAAFMLKPRLAIPMHFGDIVGTREDAERFVKLCEEQDIEARILEKS